MKKLLKKIKEALTTDIIQAVFKKEQPQKEVVLPQACEPVEVIAAKPMVEEPVVVQKPARKPRKSKVKKSKNV